MKPIDIYEIEGYKREKTHIYHFCPSETRKKIERYLTKDCIIAYHKTAVGTAFIIRGKIKFFTFYLMNKDFVSKGYDYRLHELNDALMMKIVGELNAGKGKIIAQKDFEDLKNKIILEAI